MVGGDGQGESLDTVQTPFGNNQNVGVLSAQFCLFFFLTINTKHIIIPAAIEKFNSFPDRPSICNKIFLMDQLIRYITFLLLVQ